jgi:hypothetical protein
MRWRLRCFEEGRREDQLKTVLTIGEELSLSCSLNAAARSSSLHMRVYVCMRVVTERVEEDERKRGRVVFCHFPSPLSSRRRTHTRAHAHIQKKKKRE